MSAKNRRQGLGVKKSINKQQKSKQRKNQTNHEDDAVDESKVQFQSSKQQATWFFDVFSSIHQGVLSSLELTAFPDNAMVELSKRNHGLNDLSQNAKYMVGPSWEQELCSANPTDVEPGCPSLLIISSSATRCVDLLRGLSALTKECKPAKLFAKHLKVDEQVAALKQRVNIAAGTPNRIKKLIEFGALGVSRLSIVLVDMHKDAKGWNLLTVPEVRKEFWDLYRQYLHSRVTDSKCRICLY